MNTEKSLRTQLLSIGTPKEHISNHCSDLHLLYSKEREEWLKENYEYFANVVIHRANVEGHEWHGKRFFDIPFAYVEHYNKSKPKEEYPPLRAARITYEDGASYSTSMAAGLTDEQIKEYFAPGTVHNVGHLEDKMATIAKVEVDKPFECSFTGRKIGAIGKTYKITATVMAFDEKGAEAKLYEKYEHISFLKIT